MSDLSVIGSATAQPDGSFVMDVNNPGQSASLQLTAAAAGKDESDKVTINVAKTSKPDATKIKFTNGTSVIGTTGSAAGNAKVSVTFDDSTLAGLTTSDPDGFL